eukprot:COSAG02_NODE_12430_length_1546_cov_1.019350_1_plen_102_part_00
MEALLVEGRILQIVCGRLSSVLTPNSCGVRGTAMFQAKKAKLSNVAVKQFVKAKVEPPKAGKSPAAKPGAAATSAEIPGTWEKKTMSIVRPRRAPRKILDF